MKKTIILLFVFLMVLATNITSVYANESSTFELEEAKKQALMNTRDIKKVQAQIDLLNAQENFLYDAYDVAQNSTYYSIISTTRDYDRALNLIKTSKNNWRDAEDRLDDAKVAMQNKREEVEYTVEKLYVDILKLEKQINQMETEYALQTKSLDVERLKSSLGMTTSTNVSNLAIQASNINKLIKSQKDLLTKHKWVFNEMLGRDINSKLELTEFTVEFPLPIDNPEVLIDKSLENSSIIYQQQRDINKMHDDWIDLDDSNKRKEKEALIRQTKLATEEVKSNIRNAVKLLVSDYNSKSKAFQLEKIAFENAKTNFVWEEKKYEIGMISELQLLNAKIAYQKALNSYKNSGYDYFLVKHLVELAEQGILIN